MKSKIILFVFCMLIWIGLSWPLNVAWLIAGICASSLATKISGDMFVHRPHIVMHGKRYLWIGYYLLILSGESIKANFDVVLRVLKPTIQTRSGIVKVKTKIKSEIGLTLLANSITFSKGTCTVEIDPGKGAIYVYWIDVDSQNIKTATEQIVSKFEKVLKNIFD